MTKKIFLIMFTTWQISIFSQSFFQDNDPKIMDINRKNGLESLSISSIIQDKDGIIWFGTQGALHKFNGNDIKIYSNDPFDSTSLPNNLIQTMYYDKIKNEIYIGTYNGLSIFNIKNQTFTNIQNISNNVVISIEKDRNNNIWVGTLDGLNLISSDLQKVTLLPTNHQTIRTLYLDKKDRMWVGSYGGLEIYNTETLVSTKVEEEFPSKNLMKIIGNGENSAILGFWDGGVVEYSLMDGIINKYTLENNNVYSLEKTSDGTLWAGTWGGGLWVRTSNGKTRILNKELSNGVIYSLFEDNNNLLWIGTNGGGGHLISPRKLNYSYIESSNINPNALPKGKISYIYRDIDNDLWISVNGKGLFLFNENKMEAISYKTPDLTINHIINDKDGRLWVSTNKGLININKGTNSYTTWEEEYPKMKLSHHIITGINFISKTEIWISTYGEGVDIVNIENNTIKNLRNIENDKTSLSGNTVYDIIKRKDGSIWVATNSGLSKFINSNNTFKRYNKSQVINSSISGNNVRILFEDSSNNLWIGTQSSGLNRYIDKLDNFVHYTTNDGLSNNNILSIVEGNKNEIWISTRAGINMIYTEKNQIQSLTEEDGLHSIFFDGGSLKDKNGDILFGSIHGVTKIANFKQYSNSNPPNIILTDVKINNITIPFTNNKTNIFKSNENNISFGFIGIDYESPNNLTYKYKLDGFDNKWVNGDSRTFTTYTRLRSGKYTFKVKAINSDGIESITPTTFNFKIEKVWYCTWIAIALYILLFFYLLYSFVKCRCSIIKNKKDKEIDKINNKLSLLTIKDPITDLYNRYYFNKTYIKEFHRARRAGLPLAIVLIEINNFKNIVSNNDLGDIILQKVSKILLESIKRDIDFLSMYEENKFIAILTNTEADGVDNVTTRIIKNISSIDINGLKNQISVCIGVHVGIPDNHTSSLVLINEADKALEKAKNSGDNKVEFSLNSI